MKNVIIHGDCLEVLRKMDDYSVDSVVTDPPYGLSKEPNISEVLAKWLAGEPYDHGHGGFMGKAWDSFVPHPDVWKEIYRVLKPGGHALVFAGTRTQDLMTVALRLGGFEIRDVIEWLYFSGFPKSMDVSKAFDKRAGAERIVVAEGSTVKRMIPGATQDKTGSWIKDDGRTFTQTDTLPATDLAKRWEGWGTALKPAHEPIIVARKPLAGTVAETVEKYGTGAINIDDCRVAITDESEREKYRKEWDRTQSAAMEGGTNAFGKGLRPIDLSDRKPVGRFPANCITLEDDAFFSPYFNVEERLAEVGNVTPHEICKKASKSDRNSGWQGSEIAIEPKFTRTMGDGIGARPHNESQPTAYNRNNHPTVKPIELMAWLVRLVTPPGGTTLDPFAGSGTTLVAARREGFDSLGVEQSQEYCEIIAARTEFEIIEGSEVGEISSRQTLVDITKEVAHV